MPIKHFTRCLAAIACVIAFSTSAEATVLTFDGFSSNGDLPQDFGSNAAADGAGLNVSNGATPDLALLWGTLDSGVDITAPDASIVLLPNRLEFHNSGNWTSLDTPGVLQFDLDSSGQGLDTNDDPIFPGNPFVRFNVADGWQLRLNSFDIGQASDQAAGDTVSWTARIWNAETGLSVFETAPTAQLDAGVGVDDIQLNFLGDAGVDYVLEFDDNRAEGNVRGGLDNFSFNQVTAVPEPTSMAFLALTGAAVAVRRRRTKKVKK